MNTIEELAPGQRVLARIDINAPITAGQVQDNHRFRRHAATVQQLLADDHAVALMAHQGRPGRDDHISLEQHADILSRHVGTDIEHVPDVHGDAAQERVQRLQPGEAVLLENTRFSDHELEAVPPAEHAENGFVQALAQHVDAYVNDAYSAAHRAHASLVGFPQVLDSYAGPVMQQEYAYNSSIHDKLAERVAMVVGGKKAGDVLHVMDVLSEQVDDFLVGGLVGELFLRAQGYDVGYDIGGEAIMHRQWLEHRDAINNLLANHADSIHLPEDLAYHNRKQRREEVLIEHAAKTEPYWDIGKRTVDAFTPVIADADAVFMKGAPGVFEDDTFRYGTRRLLETIAGTDCFSVVGGGDTARAVNLLGLDRDRFDHVSIAGGAYIRALTGETLPAIEALEKYA